MIGSHAPTDPIDALAAKIRAQAERIGDLERALSERAPVEDSDETGANIALNATEVTVATVNLTIPDTWTEWSYKAWAECAIDGTGATSNRFCTIRTRRDGTEDSFKGFNVLDELRLPVSLTSHETGLTTTGAVAFTFTGQLGTNDSYVAGARRLLIVATRTI